MACLYQKDIIRWKEVFLDAEELGRVVGNQLLGGESHLLELLRVWRRDLSTSDTDWRSLQVIKGVFRSEGNDLCANSEAGEARLNGHHVAGLLDGLDNSLDIQRLDAAEVDDLSLDAVLALQDLGGLEGLADASREGDDGEILSWALNLRLAELFCVSDSPYQECVEECLTGMTKSSLCASSLMGNDRPYRSSFSNTQTGLGSRMAAFNRPLASSAE